MIKETMIKFLNQMGISTSNLPSILKNDFLSSTQEKNNKANLIPQSTSTSNASFIFPHNVR
jgi:hypothetical protein